MESAYTTQGTGLSLNNRQGGGIMDAINVLQPVAEVFTTDTSKVGTKLIRIFKKTMSSSMDSIKAYCRNNSKTCSANILRSLMTNLHALLNDKRYQALNGTSDDNQYYV
jgi:hypothetical protein